MINKGSGKQAEKGKTVSVHYSGSLENGKVFDSSYTRKKPIEFPLGAM
jgi:peptidyl-prolyl cis-trans isomerase A (cyclophilin A)